MKNPALSLEKISRLLWALALVAIPVTSFRWFPLLGESRTLVRPLAMYPLALLFPLILFQAWRGTKKISWAGAFVPLGMFVLFVVASSSLGLLTDPIPLYSQDYAGRTVRALITLLIGLIFFFTAVWMNNTEEEFRFSMKWLLVGLCFNIAWSGLQAITFYTGLLDKEMVTQWQLSFSMRQLDNTRRISGLAFEPAWLAGQLATIYIPILFAAVLTNFRLTLNRWLEPVLLAVSLLLLLATYSRGGLLVTLAALGITFLLFGRDVLHLMWTWFIGGFRSRTFDLIIRLGLVAGILAGLAGSVFFLSQRNIFRNLLTANTESLSEYLVGINAGARGAYSTGAWAAYETYPFSGAGFGASGLYIYQNLPDWSLTNLPEIARQQSTQNRLYPNPKNMYIRLFAETGLLGFFLYLAFQFHLLGDILSLSLHNKTWLRFALVAGMFAWLAVAIYNFTQDSFATPNIWLMAGILAGVAAKSQKNS